MPSDFAREVRQRVGRVRHYEQHGITGCTYDLGHDVAIDPGIFAEQFEPPFRIVTIGGAPGFLIHSGSDQHDAGASQRVVVTIDDVDLGPERNAVPDIRCYCFGCLARSIDKHDLMRATAENSSHGTRTADMPSTDDSYLHGSVFRVFKRHGEPAASSSHQNSQVKRSYKRPVSGLVLTAELRTRRK